MSEPVLRRRASIVITPSTPQTVVDSASLPSPEARVAKLYFSNAFRAAGLEHKAEIHNWHDIKHHVTNVPVARHQLAEYLPGAPAADAAPPMPFEASKAHPVAPRSPDARKQTLRVVVLSDTHRCHNQLTKLLPADTDVLLHCGDFTEHGTLQEVVEFADWLTGLSVAIPYRIVVGGNHELVLDKGHRPAQLVKQRALTSGEDSCHLEDDELASASQFDPADHERALEALRRSCTYVEHGLVTVEGFRLFASPFLPCIEGHAFGYGKFKDGHAVWTDLVDTKPDIVVTHTPPLGHTDMVVRFGRLGCAHLLDAVEAAAPVLHVFGHIHKQGLTTNGKTLFVNAASVVGDNRPACDGDAEDDNDDTRSYAVQPPFVIDLPRNREKLAAFQQALARTATAGSVPSPHA